MVDPDSFDEIIEAFKKLDQNNDGLLSAKDVHYSCASHMLTTSDENELKYPDEFLKLLNLVESNAPKIEITPADFFIFLIRNLADYTDEDITNELLENLVDHGEDDEKPHCLNASNLKSLMKRARIEFTDDDLISMIEYAEFNIEGKLDQKGFNKLMQKLSSFN